LIESGLRPSRRRHSGFGASVRREGGRRQDRKDLSRAAGEGTQRRERARLPRALVTFPDL